MNETIIAAAAAAIGIVLTKVGELALTRWRSRREAIVQDRIDARRAEIEDRTELLKEHRIFIEKLQKDMFEFRVIADKRDQIWEEKAEKLAAQHATCLKENAELAVKVLMLTERIKDLEGAK